MSESILSGLKNRICQHLARILPGATSLRVALHRFRGVKIGKNAWIGYDVVLDTGFPQLITLGDNVTISMRATIIAHFKEERSVTIEDDVFIGPGAILLPNITIGKGAVVTAGSVVNRSVPPQTMVQGNPALPVARCELALTSDVTARRFVQNIRPLRNRQDSRSSQPTQRTTPEPAQVIPVPLPPHRLPVTEPIAMSVPLEHDSPYSG
jgi:serine acetyltransferase